MGRWRDLVALDFLPNEQVWVFHRLFEKCIPDMLGIKVIKRNKDVIIDGDPHMYTPLRNMQQESMSPWFNSCHKLCQYHLLVQPWFNQFRGFANNNINKNNLWIQYTIGARLGS